MIVPMKRLTLISHREYESDIMKALQKASAVEVIAPLDEKNPNEINSAVFNSYDDELKRLNQVAQKLKPYGKKSGLLTPAPNVEESVFASFETREHAINICENVESILSDIADITARCTANKNLIDQLTPWRELDVEVSKLAPSKQKKTIAVCGFLPADSAELKEDAIAVSFLNCTTENGLPCLIMYHKSDAKDVRVKLQEVGFFEYSFPEQIKGFVSDEIAKLEAQIEKLQIQASDKTKELEKIGADRETVLTAADAVEAEYARLRAMADILKSKSAFILEGWVREDETEKVQKAVEGVTDAYFIRFDPPIEGEVPPTCVKNNKFNEPFETVVNMYSRPSYEGIDATPIMAPFYTLFFGMMLADTGYGILLALGAYLFEKIKKPKGTMKGLAGVMKYGGVAAAVCGVLFGACFGVDFDAIFGTNDVFPLIIEPINNVMVMLVLCCGMGIFHMAFGLAVKMKMCISKGDVQGAIYDNLSWIMILVGIVGGVAAPSPYGTPFIAIAILGVVLILVFGGRNKKGIMRIFGGFGSIYNITSYLSDTVSYARIFALGLVGGAMGEVFNMIGAMVGGAGSGFMRVITLLFAAVILIALHAFSLFINTLGAFAHTSRLQYVEFFGKFYESGGREFKPLSINPRNINIVNGNSREV